MLPNSAASSRQRRSALEDRKVLALHARTEPYREIWNRFSAVIDDYDDCEVLLDAHHVAAAIDGTVLYTGDYRHIVANRELILSATRLHDVRYLGDRAGGRRSERARKCRWRSCCRKGCIAVKGRTARRFRSINRMGGTLPPACVGIPVFFENRITLKENLKGLSPLRDTESPIFPIKVTRRSFGRVLSFLKLFHSSCDQDRNFQDVVR